MLQACATQMYAKKWSRMSQAKWARYVTTEENRGTSVCTFTSQRKQKTNGHCKSNGVWRLPTTVEAACKSFHSIINKSMCPDGRHLATTKPLSISASINNLFQATTNQEKIPGKWKSAMMIVWQISVRNYKSTDHGVWLVYLANVWRRRWGSIAGGPW